MESTLSKSIAKAHMRSSQMFKLKLSTPLLTILSKETIHLRIDRILGLIMVIIMTRHKEITKIKATLTIDTEVETVETTTKTNMRMNLVKDLMVLGVTIIMEEAETITGTLSLLIRISTTLITQNLVMRNPKP